MNEKLNETKEEVRIRYVDFMKLMKHERRIKGRKEGNLDGFTLIDLPKSWEKKTVKKEYKGTRKIEVRNFKKEKMVI